MLTPELGTFEELAAWITSNVKCDNSSNMIVCLKDSLPPILQAASPTLTYPRHGRTMLWPNYAMPCTNHASHRPHTPPQARRACGRTPTHALLRHRLRARADAFAMRAHA